MFDLYKPTVTPKTGMVMMPEINIDSDFEEWFRRLVDEARGQVAEGKGPIVRPLTLKPDFARVLIEHNTHNRKPSQSVVDKYARAMQAGLWELTMECITVDRDGFIQEGGHRLTACIKSGITIPCHIAFGSDPKVFDIIGQGKHRNAGDILQIHGVANSSKMSELCRLIYLYDENLKVFNTSRDLTHRGISEYVSVHHDAMQNSLTMQRLAQKEKLPRANVYAAAHYCITALVGGLKEWLISEGYKIDEIRNLLISKEEAIEIWFLNLLKNTNISEGTTIWYLRKKLQEGAINRHAYGPPRAEALFTFLIRAWNAHASSQNPLRKFHYTHLDGIPRIHPAREWVNVNTNDQQIMDDLEAGHTRIKSDRQQS